jgi:Tfp pilus assembly protein PilV
MNKLKRTTGFSLIEAMIALIIMSFGILGLAKVHMMIANNTDVSRQRAEALRLAQQRLETMRAYPSVSSTGAPSDPDRGSTCGAGGATACTLSWNDFGVSGTTYSDANNPLTTTNFTNTNFTRQWALSDSTSSFMRTVSVSVWWRDRTTSNSSDPNQHVTLTSVISLSDPKNEGALGFPLPNNTNLKLPKNRSINIPVPAVSVGNGQSAYNVGNNLAVIFSNTSGYVVQKCTTSITDASSYTTAQGNGSCTTYNAYIIAGYVTGAISNSGSSPSIPTGINTSLIDTTTYDTTRSISCSYGIATNQTTGASISTAHYYLCIIPVTSSGAKSAWSGKIYLGGVPMTSNYKVCRFQYNDNGSMDVNQRNVQPYVSVNESLDNQNYYIDNSNGSSCSTPSGLTGATMQLHQDCRNSSTPSQAVCPTTVTGT